ncbi:hypothetical protein HPP92_022986 [Vanilla planifolia]|uniref:Uncharacterized protein n=1 Tax=Vanilla planifolia TaxID=51239 RepID=A0A835UCN8_VANPL|nr:hypothetical protein HPP92_023251 [Vanilla planifolia]KAG0459858.1 hypothetical protein HPP92_022986 [Vanilla planifolia]
MFLVILWLFSKAFPAAVTTIKGHLLSQYLAAFQREAAMPRLPVFLFIVVLISLLTGHVDGFNFVHGAEHVDQLIKIRARKVMVAMNDYDYGKPNNKHDPPPKAKPGPGGRNR